MLANVLAVLLGSGSFVFYMAAFFYPEVHRRSDFLWSGLGLFYAVVLWFCAGQMTGAVLLGQLTAVTLLLGLGWQTLTVRREKTPISQQTPVVLTPEVVTDWAKNRLNQLRLVPDESVRPIRLKKRLSDSSAGRANQRLDPRRRPVYEYEFVEDGILATLPEPSAAMTAQALTEVPTAIEPATEPDYTAPPSAEAEVISVETAESKDAPLNLEDRSAAASEESIETIAEQDVQGTEVSSEEAQDAPAIIGLEADQSVADPLDVEQAVVSQSEADSLSIDRPVGAEAEADVKAAVTVRAEGRSPKPDEDWGDDFLEADPLAPNSPDSQKAGSQKTGSQKAGSQKAGSQKAREQPSLLAAPAILIGWMKDVITSFTKPKSAKPVIDIPRRSPPTDPPASQSLPEDPPPQPIGAEPADNLTEDDWEESNWDD